MLIAPKVQLVDQFRAFYDLRGNSLFIRDLFLVLQRMLETCSEIHRNGPELHLNPDHFYSVSEKSESPESDEDFGTHYSWGGVIHTNAPFLFSL